MGSLQVSMGSLGGFRGPLCPYGVSMGSLQVPMGPPPLTAIPGLRRLRHGCREEPRHVTAPPRDRWGHT